ncbi:MAG: radical SAM protein [Flexilinea sp.]
MKFITAKTILSGYSDNNTWFGANYNMNIYKGCCHGCIYCDSRSDCYGVQDFDEVKIKENALAIIERELRSKRKKGVVGTGSMSDPYNPFEKTYQLTRGALELIDRYKFGVCAATKSDLILRDTDILQKIAEHSPTIIQITITTADDDLCKKIEPRAAVSSDRFKAVRILAEAGIFTGILLMPVLPFLEDSEENIGQIIQMARENGARFIYPAFGVTLRQNQREWYLDKLEHLFPGVKEKTIKAFGCNYECQSPNARALWSLFQNQCNHLGIIYQMADIIKAYKEKYTKEQLPLF